MHEDQQQLLGPPTRCSTTGGTKWCPVTWTRYCRSISPPPSLQRMRTHARAHSLFLFLNLSFFPLSFFPTLTFFSLSLFFPRPLSLFEEIPEVSNISLKPPLDSGSDRKKRRGNKKPPPPQPGKEKWNRGRNVSTTCAPAATLIASTLNPKHSSIHSFLFFLKGWNLIFMTLQCV